MNLNNTKTSIIGLGYLGLHVGVEFGKKSVVLGFDINAKRIAELQSGQDNMIEISSAELQTASQLRFSSNPADLKGY